MSDRDEREVDERQCHLMRREDGISLEGCCGMTPTEDGWNVDWPWEVTLAANAGGEDERREYRLNAECTLTLGEGAKWRCSQCGGTTYDAWRPRYCSRCGARATEVVWS